MICGECATLSFSRPLLEISSYSPTGTFFASVDHINVPLKKHRLSSRGSKGHVVTCNR